MSSNRVDQDCIVYTGQGRKIGRLKRIVDMEASLLRCAPASVLADRKMIEEIIGVDS